MPTVLVSLLQSSGTKGGIEAYIKALYQAIGKDANEFRFVGFASTELYASGAPWFPGEIVNSGISGENRFRWAWGELFGVSHFAKNIKADLIHGPAMLGPWKSNIPVVITVHDLSYFSNPELMQTALYTAPVKIMERIAAANATRLISISRTTSRAISKYLKAPDSKIDLVHSAGRELGVVPKGFEHRTPDSFLAMGQRSRYKDFQTLLKAWTLLPKTLNLSLTITGSHGQDPLRRDVQKLGLADSISLLEWITDEELTDLMSTSTAFIETTRAGGFGMPSVEAMGIGLPVISTDIEVFQEILGDAALYFKAGDPESLATKILEIVENPSILSESANRGFLKAAEYSWGNVARGTLDSFRLALG